MKGRVPLLMILVLAMIGISAYYGQGKQKAAIYADDHRFSDSTAATNHSACPEMVRVDGGTFYMGSNRGESDERPVHLVSVNSFNISKTEITNIQYAAFLNECSIGSSGNLNGNKLIDLPSEYCKLEYIDGKWRTKAGYENYPAVMVTWYGACEYCSWAGGRLPTEAEWEYAASGGCRSNGYTYAGSNRIEEVAWFTDNSGNRVHEVAAKKPNELGLYDMSGNVWEWCYDWYSGSYSSRAQNNPVGASSGSDRVSRGGSWYDNTVSCRVANRYYGTPGYGDILLGFRLVRNSK
jgi:formylglycine-generating enzyme required for sulfatase activity